MALIKEPHCISNQLPECTVKSVSTQHSGPVRRLLFHTHLTLNAAVTRIYKYFKIEDDYDFKSIHEEIDNLIDERNPSDKERLSLYCRLLCISNEKRDKLGSIRYLQKAQEIEYHPYREFCILIAHYKKEERITQLKNFLIADTDIDDFTKAKVNECIAITYGNIEDYNNALYYYAIAMSYGGLAHKYVDHFTMIGIVENILAIGKPIDHYGLTHFEKTCINVIKKCMCNGHRIAALIIMETNFLNCVTPNLRFWRTVHYECDFKSFLPELLNYKFHFPLAHATHLYTFTNLFSYLLYKLRLPKKAVYTRKEAQFYYLPFETE